ncbi:MAG: OmpA family protein [Chitinivibrionales bacterium]|nr:OmpA family protein [Chitinivibrionales bacterium]
MKSARNFVIVVILFAASASYGVVDQNPLNAGATQTRNAGGTAPEAVFHNPALLGVEKAPAGGLLLIPVTNFGVGYWSDKLAVSPFDLPPFGSSDSVQWRQYLDKLFRKSFNITDQDTGIKATNKLVDGFKGGMTLYSGARTSIFSYTQRPFAFDITTHFDEQIHLPEAALDVALMLFDHGLQRGSNLDFTDFNQEGIWATDITLQCGLPVMIPALSDLFKMQYGAGGLGLKYIMGHSILKAQMPTGKLSYNASTNSIDLDGSMVVQTAGAGLHSNFPFDKYHFNDFSTSLQVNGHGIGVDIGGIMYNEHSFLSVNVENLGVIFWLSNVKEATYKIKVNNLDFYDINQGVEKTHHNSDSAGLMIFNRNQNQYLSNGSDTLHESNGFATILPLTLNIGYSYTWPLAKQESPALQWLSDYISASANYEQSFTNNPGYSYWPRLTLGAEVGTLKGFFPIRAGLILGGAEKIGSALGASFNFKYFSLNGAYKAIGSPVFIPTHGIEVSAGMTINWGMKNPGHGEKPKPILAVARHDTLAVHDTTIHKDTVRIHDTTTITVRDTIVQIKALPTEKEQKALNKALRGINFKTGSAELTSDSYTYLMSIVTFLKQYSYLRYEIQGHTDAQGSADLNLLLSAARANSVRNYLVEQGIPDSSVIAIGYGKTKPIAPNTTAAGRALNRRVVFQVIETPEEYQRLRVLEADFKVKVMESQIKGARY